VRNCFPELDERRQMRCALAAASFFGPHFPCINAALQGNKEQFLEWCAIGRALPYGVASQGPEATYFEQFSAEGLAPLRAIHARLAAAQDIKVAFRGVAFATQPELEAYIQYLRQMLGKLPMSFTSELARALPFTGGVSCSHLIMRKHLKCKYPQEPRNETLIVICTGIEFLDMAGWNHMNDSEREVWPRVAAAEPLRIRFCSRDAHDIRKFLMLHREDTKLSDTDEELIISHAEKHHTTICVCGRLPEGLEHRVATGEATTRDHLETPLAACATAPQETIMHAGEIILDTVLLC
jgi:hypothetical protein